jgi:hypothetical protein
VSGKAYANRKEEKERPKGDFYETPYSLLWALYDQTNELKEEQSAYDPCAGNGALIEAGKKIDLKIDGDDWFYGTQIGKQNRNFYDFKGFRSLIVTNFPFSEWDKMVWKGLSVSKRLITIGRVNYFGTHSRNENGLWKYLSDVYVFDRMTDYRAPIHPEGLFHVGALVTGWFVFDSTQKTDNTRLRVLDVQKYAKLGAFDGV